MSGERPAGKRSHLSPTGMLLGGLVGGIVGALARGGITFFNLREGGELGLLASLPSAGIGFLCGAVAGSFCRGWLGALVGAFLSAGVFGLFVLPFAYVFALFTAADKVASLTWLYFVQKAVAGAVAGAAGGVVGRLIVASEAKRIRFKEKTP